MKPCGEVDAEAPGACAPADIVPRELGRIGELRKRLPGLIDDARLLHDLYAEVTFRLYESLWDIARGDVQRARDGAQDVLERWSAEGFHMQHFYALRIQALCDVYEGSAAAGWERLRDTWPGRT